MPLLETVHPVSKLAAICAQVRERGGGVVLLNGEELIVLPYVRGGLTRQEIDAAWARIGMGHEPKPLPPSPPVNRSGEQLDQHLDWIRSESGGELVLCTWHQILARRPLSPEGDFVAACRDLVAAAWRQGAPPELVAWCGVPPLIWDAVLKEYPQTTVVYPAPGEAQPGPAERLVARERA